MARRPFQGILLWVDYLLVSAYDLMTVQVLGDTAQLMGPLLVKAIIKFGKARIEAKTDGDDIPNVGRGIGMAIGLFCVTVMAALCQHQVWPVRLFAPNIR